MLHPAHRAGGDRRLSRTATPIGPIITGRLYNDDQPIPYKSPTQERLQDALDAGRRAPATYRTRSCSRTRRARRCCRSTPSWRSGRSGGARRLHQRWAGTRPSPSSATRPQRGARPQAAQMNSATKRAHATVDQKNTVKGAQNNQVVGNRLTFIDANDALSRVGGTSTVDVTGARRRHVARRRNAQRGRQPDGRR